MILNDFIEKSKLSLMTREEYQEYRVKIDVRQKEISDQADTQQRMMRVIDKEFKDINLHLS